MSTQQTSTAVVASADFVARALAGLPSPISFLSDDAAHHLKPVNTNVTWASGAGKRALDLLIAVPLVLVLLPLLAMIAIAVKLDSKGPALFRQTRTGICGRPFQIFKFRTMSVMENGSDVVQAREADPRVTRLGAVLRHYSLDELPQLFNVIMGDMSLVGPRPHAEVHDSYYSAHIAEYRHRFAVKPGMTGWAQIHGFRGPTPALEDMAIRVAHDTYYARRADLALDIKILAATPFALFHATNAL